DGLTAVALGAAGFARAAAEALAGDVGEAGGGAALRVAAARGAEQRAIGGGRAAAGGCDRDDQEQRRESTHGGSAQCMPRGRQILQILFVTSARARGCAIG